MNRRHVILLGAAALVAPARADARYEALEYQWGMRSDLRQTGQTVIYNFRTSWSLTCKIKQDMLAELKAETPAYRALTFVDVDFDTYGPSQWVERMKVERRSTLVAMKGEAEIARIVNQPEKDRLRRLLDAALSA